jgi:hypothetical protein
VAHWHKALIYDDVDTVLTATAQMIAGLKRFDARSRKVGFSSAPTLAAQRALGRYVRQLEEISREMAIVSEQAMRQQFKDSRRRDQSGIKTGREALLPNLVSRPVRLGGLMLGSVGIADVERMDRVINPLMRTAAGRKPYWRAQEYGSAHLVGKQLRGMFYDTGGVNPTRPGAGSGQPIFLTNAAIKAWGADPGESASGGRATMLVRNPIRPKGFIAAGVKAAVGPWNAKISAAEGELLRELRALAPLAAGGGRRR